MRGVLILSLCVVAGCVIEYKKDGDSDMTCATADLDTNAYIRYQNYNWNNNTGGGYPVPDEIKDNVAGAMIGSDSEVSYVDLLEVKANRVHRVSVKSPLIYPISGPVQLLQDVSGDSTNAGLLEVIFFRDRLPKCSLNIGRSSVRRTYQYNAGGTTYTFEYPTKFPPQASQSLSTYINGAINPTIMTQGRNAINITFFNNSGANTSFDLRLITYRTFYGGGLGVLPTVAFSSGPITTGIAGVQTFSFTRNSSPALSDLAELTPTGSMANCVVIFEVFD